MSNLKNKKVFVTGASGFVGTALCEKLFHLGATVGVVQHENEVTAPYDYCYELDLNSFDDIYRSIQEFSPDFVVHLASQAIVDVGNNRPSETIETNVIGTTNILQSIRFYMRTYNSVRTIVASTDKVYGRHINLPYDESYSLLGTKQIYEASKNCEDVLSQAFAYSYGMEIVITRFGNIYGPGDSHNSRLIPGTILNYLHNEPPRIRSNGQQYRDYVYIDDAVGGYIKLLEMDQLAQSPFEQTPYIYNFGSGFGSRVLDVVTMISEYFPDAPLPIIEYGAKEEIHRQYLDSTKARNKLGWIPETKLKDGIYKTVEWYREQYDKSN